MFSPPDEMHRGELEIGTAKNARAQTTCAELPVRNVESSHKKSMEIMSLNFCARKCWDEGEVEDILVIPIGKIEATVNKKWGFQKKLFFPIFPHPC